ncbi:hypothetical protein [Bacillus suaedae]|uniref:Uncharacterized protein n=1 Tax=Halalkalibacter suaedae TaxID=2822140 RepID=A0A940WXU3_9BACI|nr:hypothetical protein [Bacillus suaedae]MBP3950340.1 hypothetical protein [Bacillus suaedae]
MDLQIPFGLADITVGEGADAIKFDGKTDFQADGGELTLTPIFQDINIADFGETVYDRRITGHEGTLTIVAAEDKVNILQLALSSAEAITDSVSGDVTGLMDGKMGTSMRTRGKKVTIHPRVMGTETSADIVIYKMASDGDFTRSFANEQGNIEITMSMYPRDGMDASKPGNFYYIGGTDPNVA